MNRVLEAEVISITLLFSLLFNSPISHSARYQRPARERHKICIASLENVDNQTPRNTKFYTLARFSLLLNVDITILYPNTHTLTVYM